MRLYLKIVPNGYENESRDRRELSVVKSFNLEIVVMAKGEYNHIVKTDDYTIHKRSTRPFRYCSVKFNRILSVFTWASYARCIKPYCISCHDLIALFIGWISTWFIPKRKKPLLVYDAHEFEMGRNTAGKRTKFVKFIIPFVEKFLMKKCVFSIMVNDSIADEVQKIYKLKERPVVVRNIPKYWTIVDSVCNRRKEEICEQLGVSVNTFIVMYHGYVFPGRGIEILLSAISKNNKVAIVVLGNGEKYYIEQLKQMAEELRITERVLFHKAVSIDVLWQYVGAADAGMITIPAVSKSYYYMLPNKLFENIQALTPIIGSNFPEISKIITEYNIGLLVNPENIDEVASAIEKMRKNEEMYSKYKINLIQAKKELCWGNENKILKEVYGKILE